MSATALNSLVWHNETIHQRTYISLQNVQPTPDIYFNSVSEMEAVVPNDSIMSSESGGSENYNPYLTILVQPVENFRFRYESEKGSHGGITGASKINKSKKSFPTVRLENYHSHEEVVVRASLYTDDANPRPHILQLVGKKCKDGVCIQKLSNDFTAQFQSMTIRNKKKEEVADILKRRKISRLESLRQAFDEDLIEKEVQEEVKGLNLNRVKLCFEVFRESDLNSPLCSKIFSNPICNQKNAISANLRIVRLSHSTGTCRGQQDILIFCDKVDKDDIKVRFHEKKENGETVWEAFADFNPAADVHHQYAIGFRTPPYKRNIETEVCVYIDLYRPSDRKYGEPKEFLYIPDDNDISRFSNKRKRPNPPENLTETAILNHGASTSEDNSSSQDSNLSFKKMNFPSVPDATYEEYGSGSPLDIEVDERDLIGSSSDLISLLQSMTYQYEDSSNLSLLDVFLPEENDQIDVPHGEMMEVLHCGTSHTAGFLPLPDPENGLKTDAVAVQIKDSQYKAYRTAVNKNIFRHLRNIIAHLGIIAQIGSLRNNTNIQTGNLETRKKIKLAMGMERTLNNKYENIYLHYMPRLVSLQDQGGNTFLHLAVMGDCEDLIVKIVAVASENVLNIQNKFKQTALHLATSRNNSKVLQHLLMHGGNPNIPNQDGNNCLHLASKFNSVECMKILLCDNKDHDKFILDINGMNYEGFAPLHLSTLNNFKDAVQLLLDAHANVNIVERKCGRSPLHLAIELQSSAVSDILLSQPDIDLEAVDFRGHTPLHIPCDVTGESYEDISFQMEDAKNVIISSLRKLHIQKCQDERVQAGYVSCTETCSDSESDEEAPEGDKETLLRQTNEKVHFENCTVTNCNYKSSNGPTEIPFFTLHEREVCHVLDVNSNWRKLGMLIGLDESLLKGVEKFNKVSSPTKTILRHLKKLYPGCDKKTFLNILEMAELKDAAKRIEDMFDKK